MGGNIFQNTSPIRKEDIGPTLSQFKLKLHKIFPKIHFDFKLLGSAGKKDISNDIDLALSEDTIFDRHETVKYHNWEIDCNQYALVYEKIRRSIRTATEKQSKIRALIKLIANKLIDNHILADPINSGAGSLFCCFPQYSKDGQLDKTVQIDINIGNVDWLLFSYYSEAYEGNIKGLHRTQLLVSLFANKNYIFRHGSGIYNKETNKYEATTPKEAVALLRKLYKLRFRQPILCNFILLNDFLASKLETEELFKIYDIYLKILDSTKADIPEGFLQIYWKQHRQRLSLTGKYLPKDSKLQEFIND